MVKPFLPINGEGHILLTTTAHAIPPQMKSVEFKQVEREEGVLFLLRRARIIKDASHDTASTQDRAIASKIVQMLGFLPLVLDQAGAYIQETWCRLSDYFQILRVSFAVIFKTQGKCAMISE